MFSNLFGVDMLRTAIAYYLMLSSLAGPALCCCSLGQLFRSPVGHATTSSCNHVSTHTHDHSHGHAAHGHCGDKKIAHSGCHHQSKRGTPESPDDCPCGHQQDKTAIILSDSGKALTFANTLGFDQQMTLVLLVPPAIIWGNVASEIVAQHALDSPYLTSTGLLRALCVLRC